MWVEEILKILVSFGVGAFGSWYLTKRNEAGKRWMVVADAANKQIQGIQESAIAFWMSSSTPEERNRFEAEIETRIGYLKTIMRDGGPPLSSEIHPSYRRFHRAVGLASREYDDLSGHPLEPNDPKIFQIRHSGKELGAKFTEQARKSGK